MKKYAENVCELIGSTPIIKLNNIKELYDLKADIYAKLESFNPASSAKDRVALNMIKDLEDKGILNENTVIIEPTSGNTGIGLAAVCASKNIRLIIVMPDSMSIERRKLMAAYGAELILTDGKLGMSGAISKAEELNKEILGSVIAGQFTNFANPEAHYKTTGPEIFEQMDGEIDYFVAGIGTGGTISGVGKYLKEKNNSIDIVGYEPEGSPFITKKQSGAHLIQGLGAGFIPEVLNLDVVDEVVTVTNEDAYEMAKIAARKEGLLIGISSGGALSVAKSLASKEENRGKKIVVLFPDTGEHYLSTEGFIEL